MSRGGSFDRHGAGPEFYGWWRIRAFQYRSESGGLKNPHTSAQLFGIDPSHTQWCRARRRWKCAVCKGFVNSTDAASIAAPPRCSLEITCNQVNMLTKHNCWDGKDEFFRNTPFSWSGYLLIWRNNTVKVFWPLSGGRRNETRASTPCITHPCSSSITWSGKSRLVSWR